MASQGTERNLVFVSDVPMEVIHLMWNISNFPALTDIPGALQKLNLQFQAGSTIGIPSKWMFLLDRREDDIGLFWKLVESPANVEKVFVRVDMVINKCDGTEFRIRNSLTVDMKDVEQVGWSNIGSIISFLSPATNVLDDGCLKIELRLEMYGSVVNKWTQDSKVARLRELSVAAAAEDFAEAYKAGTNTDATIVSEDGKEFPVHRLALEARSVVFAAMFQSEMQEKATGRVTLNLSSRATEIMLRHIYFGTLENVWIEVAAEIMDAAEQYQLKDLKDFCDLTLINACTPGRAFELLGISRRYKLEIAASDIAKYIRSNLETVL